MMGLPGLGGIDVAKSVNELLTLLREMNRKLDVLIEIQSSASGPKEIEP